MKAPYSIRETARRLPAHFIERLYRFFPPPLYDRILRGYASPRHTTLRANILKTDIRGLMASLKEAGISFERVLWYDAALIIKNKREKDIEMLDAYKEGFLYLQSLSSMVPPLVLDPGPGEEILDMAAAPGSKSTQMAMMMQNRGHILANDINAVRAERLRYNVKLQGASIIEVAVGDGGSLGMKYPEHFDKVLLDAPCSGEGLFLAGDPGTFRGWNIKRIRRLASLQKRLLRSAIASLKPGGVLVYSTCTLSPEENELNVDWALKRFEGKIKILPVSLNIPDAINGITEFDAGPDTCEPGPSASPRGVTALSPEIKRCVRILPSDMMEGFFICLIKKIAST